ncbi:MAG: contractile injection system protein, VgrG/Pvc8 family [Polyangiaceae bacterium]
MASEAREETAMNVTISIPGVGVQRVRVDAATGEEALGRPFRFEVTFEYECLDPDAIVGQPATLDVGGQPVRGIVSAIASLDTERDPNERARCSITLVPVVALLSFSRRSRSFERLTTPEVIATILASSGLDLRLEVDLEAPCPRRAWTVQHRETDLDFVLRLLEGDGLTLTCGESAVDGGAVVRLTDENARLPHQGGVRALESSKRETRILPRRLELFGVDPTRPHLPLRASTIVSERGIGDIEVVDERFTAPEEGARAVQLAKERVLTGGTRIVGNAGDVVRAGAARVGRDEVVVVSAAHTFADGRWRTRFQALPATVRFRPEIDPTRAPAPPPVPIGAAANAERTVLRGASGALFEMSGPPGESLGRTEGVLDASGEMPQVQHHTTSTPTGVADTYLRFLVPHPVGTSYVRIGDAPTDATFDESGKYGEIEREAFAQNLGLNWDNNKNGFFDYTDGSRTEITKKDWEHVVSGKGRLAVFGGGDDPIYEMVVGSDKTYIQAQTPQWSYSTGAKVEYFGGLKASAMTGVNFDLSVGGKAAMAIGFDIGLTAGNKVEYVFQDSYEVRRGEELGLGTTVDKRATDKIQFSILPKGAANTDMDKWFVISGVMAALGGVATAALGECSTKFKDGDTVSTAVSGGVGALMAIIWAIMRAKSTERDLLDGNPIVSVDKGATPADALAALRSDDWALLLRKDHAVLGKNKPYAVGSESVTALTKADAGAAIIIEDVSPTVCKLTLQGAAQTAGVDTVITMTDGKIVIQSKTSVTVDAPTIDIKNSAGDAAVTINGTLNVKKAVTFDDTCKVKNQAVQVA